MDDGGPSDTWVIFILVLIIDVIIYSFGAAIRLIRRDDIESKLKEEAADSDEVSLEGGNPSFDKKSQIILSILDNPSVYLSTVMSTVLIINILLGRLVLPILGSFIAGLFADASIDASSIVSELIAGIILLYFFVTFGSVVPKKIASGNALSCVYAFCRPVHFFMMVLYPFTWLVLQTSRGVLHVFGIKNDLGESDVTEEEIRSMVSEGQEQGVLQDSEADMISNIFEFSDKEAKDIMTHRNDIVGIDGNMNLQDAVEFMLETNNSRFPVFLDNIDHIIGIIHIRDAMKLHAAGRKNNSSIKKIRELIREPMYVPETKKIDSIFRSMQSSKTQMVVVIDEYGQTSGIVSMEDILEEIVGNIMDEYDEDEKYLIATPNRNEFIAEGRTPLEIIEKKFGIELGAENYETLNGLMISKLDRIPEEGEQFDTDMEGYNFKIQTVSGHMISSVLITKLSENTEVSENSNS